MSSHVRSSIYITDRDKDELISKAGNANIYYHLKRCLDFRRCLLRTGFSVQCDIDIEILFCIEYYRTCNTSPVGLLLRQTRINKHFLK